MLEEEGYPFKSKEHSEKVAQYQNSGVSPYIERYINKGEFGCPDLLKYQFTPSFHLKVSKQCCYKLKKAPAHKWAKENSKTITITGMRGSEGGTRNNLGCIITAKDGSIKKFHPLINRNSSFFTK